MEVEVSLRVRYGETDKMGVVYYGRYLDWFEVGRTEFCRSLGFPYSELEKRGIFMPAVESWCRYKAPAFYDDLISIKVKIEEIKDYSVSFLYRVERDGKLIALGRTKHCFVDKNGKMVKVPEEFLLIIRREG
ncbi:MAG: acyl-CoA thioesterase [Synergistetes bacterium]|nr:acyl-CoA thioesterase [Synergistota bacterium]MCX8127873.1 acyl-CoA thioesterase [Synergistota bacterium]MDW8192135.1 thioesterase family protein [Synergistota bacterium]